MKKVYTFSRIGKNGSKTMKNSIYYPLLPYTNKRKKTSATIYKCHAKITKMYCKLYKGRIIEYNNTKSNK